MSKTTPEFADAFRTARQLQRRLPYLPLEKTSQQLLRHPTSIVSNFKNYPLCI